MSFANMGDCMKEKWKIAVAFLVLGVFIAAGNLRVSATESEDLFQKEILDDSMYVKAILGGGYFRSGNDLQVRCVPGGFTSAADG